MNRFPMLRLARPLSQSQNRALVQNLLHSTSVSPIKIQFSGDQRRNFNSSSKKEAGEAVAEINVAAVAGNDNKEGENNTLRQIIGKYGWYPLGGLLTAAALSKEILFVGPELLILGTTSAVMTTIYMAVQEPIGEAINKEIEAENEAKRDGCEFAYQWEKMTMEKWEAETQRPALYKEWMDSYIKTGEAMKEAAERKQRLDLYASTQHKLDQLLASEKALLDAVQTRVFTDIMTEVCDQVQNDKKIQNAAIDAAIASIGTDGTDQTDLVQGLLKDIVAKKLAAAEKQEGGK